MSTATRNTNRTAVARKTAARTNARTVTARKAGPAAAAVTDDASTTTAVNVVLAAPGSRPTAGPFETVTRGRFVVQEEPDFSFPYVTLTYALGRHGIGTFRLLPTQAFHLADALDWHVAVAAGMTDPDGDRPYGSQVRDLGEDTLVTRVDLHAPYLAQVRLHTARPGHCLRGAAPVVVRVGPGGCAMTAQDASTLAAGLRSCADAAVKDALRH